MLTHLDSAGNPKIVDISQKEITNRKAIAAGYIILCEQCAQQINNGNTLKGHLWNAVHLGAINGAKHTWEVIPLAHHIPLDSILVKHHWDPKKKLAWIMVEVTAHSRTGVEMEALNGVTSGLLIIYDMLKAVSHKIEIGSVRLMFKTGGTHGLIVNHWQECPWYNDYLS